MSRAGEAPGAHAVRVLASPVFVLALVTLILNDHVLKQAWPGLVTGKLSDVAGLVVAPLLLHVLLAVLRVPKAMTLAATVTGLGFVFCKTSEAGAAATSAVWSLFGTPTLIRADVTDLVALPALYVAWWIQRTAVSESGIGWRRTVAAAVGMAMLPVGVLATTATSCLESEGYTRVGLVEGPFGGPPKGTERRLAVGTYYSLDLTIDGSGRFGEPAAAVDTLYARERVCVGTRCWRISGPGVLEGSIDHGLTWSPEARLTSREIDEIFADIGGTDGGCDGEPPALEAIDIAALPTEGEPLVVVALQRGGIWLRDRTGSWEVFTEGELRDLEVPTPTARTTVTVLDDPPQPTEPPDPGSPGVREPTPTCAHPSPTTITPNPSNGPPTTYDVCP